MSLDWLVFFTVTVVDRTFSSWQTLLNSLLQKLDSSSEQAALHYVAEKKVIC